jgi:hypothetical protein
MSAVSELRGAAGRLAGTIPSQLGQLTGMTFTFRLDVNTLSGRRGPHMCLLAVSSQSVARNDPDRARAALHDE